MEMKLTMSDEDKYLGSIGGPRELPPGVAISPPNTKVLSGVTMPNPVNTGTLNSGEWTSASSSYQFGNGG